MSVKPNKPVVFVASPYTRGDVAVNVHFQCRVFDTLLGDGYVLPYVPLWSHFQHTLYPRPYADWIAYDQEMLKLCDCCLRLSAEEERLQYQESASSGADGEVAAFKALGKPVFFSIAELYEWVHTESHCAKQAP